MPRLMFNYPSDLPHSFELTTDEVTIGRCRDCDIIIPGHFIQRRHAVLQRENGGAYRLFDLDSRNGVWLNQSRIPAEGVVLAHGMEFFVADVLCRFCEDDCIKTSGTNFVTVVSEGAKVTISVPGYIHISRFASFSDKWDAEVVPLLATFEDRQVTADLRGCSLTFAGLLEKLRVAGQLLAKNRNAWNVRLSGEQFEMLCTQLRMTPLQASEFLASVCHTSLTAREDQGADSAAGS